ncbi:oligosaccharide flippase family protein [Massilia sp. H-1]|nr:oligosaccharide flippase family protein [Massilia sp. H-1]
MRHYLFRHRAFWRFSLPSNLLNVLVGQLPLFMIGARYGALAAGLFALTQRVLSAPVALLASSVLEVFKRQSVQDFQTHGNCRDAYLYTFKALVVLGIGPSLVLLLFSPQLFAWVFGQTWRPAEARWRRFWRRCTSSISSPARSAMCSLWLKQTKDGPGLASRPVRHDPDRVPAAGHAQAESGLVCHRLFPALPGLPAHVVAVLPESRGGNMRRWLHSFTWSGHSVGMLAFLALFPGFFFYHTLLGLGMTGAVLGGYFAPVSLLIAPPLAFFYAYLLRRRGWQLGRPEVFFLLYVAYFLTVIAIQAAVGANRVILGNHLLGVMFIVNMFLMFRLTDFSSTAFRFMCLATIA